MRSILFAVLVSTSAIAGCDASEPGVDGPGPDAAMVDAQVVDEGVPLHVDGIPPTSYWNTVPVFGRGPANGTIIIESTAGTVSVDAASDGSFCLDVDLLKGMKNTLIISAINQIGERSESQTFSLSQEGEPPEPGDPVPAKNIALGGLPTDWTSVDEEEGVFAAMTDDNISSSVVLQNGFGDDFLVLQLPIADSVERIRVTSDKACHLSDYLLHTAKTITVEQQISFGLMETDIAPWTFQGHSGQDGSPDVNVTDCSTQTYSCQEYNFDPTVIKFIGMRFLNHICSSTLGYGERRVRQIEAWTPEGVAPPTISAPTCQGG